MIKIFTIPCFILLCLAANSCATTTGSITWPIDWTVEGYQDHPLVGRIWRQQEQEWATPKQLRAAVVEARFALLGETHDNPDHHRLQAQLLKVIAASGRAPTVAFEMLDMSQQPALTTFLNSGSDDVKALGEAMNWSASSWPSWSIYSPIAEVALAFDLKIIAANLPAKKVKAIAFKGYETLDPDRVKVLGLDKPWPESLREAMREELYVSHCKLMPKSALTGLIHAQRARNAIMAWRLLETASPDGAVLIAGGGHARTDRGVPLNLRSYAPDATVVSVAMVEVSPGKHKPSDYTSRYIAERLPFDYVIFTPRRERGDVCEGLRQQFGKSPGKAQ